LWKEEGGAGRGSAARTGQEDIAPPGRNQRRLQVLRQLTHLSVRDTQNLRFVPKPEPRHPRFVLDRSHPAVGPVLPLRAPRAVPMNRPVGPPQYGSPKTFEMFGSHWATADHIALLDGNLVVATSSAVRFASPAA
jgi:hypothetical protein